MNYDLKQIWLSQEKASFKGWDFEHLDGKWEGEPLPWEYSKFINKYLKKKDCLLDMGTGGGEFLLSLGHPTQNTSVTEAWEPNVLLCKEKLSPLGICVKQVFHDSQLPFADNAFDIVINRHEAYDLKEVKRILKLDGYFITQQVGGKNNQILSNALISDFKPLYPKLTLKNELQNFISTGFDILYNQEFFPYLRFFDIGAVVFYAKIIEWEFPNFSVEKCYAQLCHLHDVLAKQGYVQSQEHRFIIVAKNKK